MKIAFISDCNTVVHPFDIQYLSIISNDIRYFRIDVKEYAKHIYDIITNNHFDVYILKNFSKLNSELIFNIKEALNKVLLKTTVNILIVDIFYPSVENTREEEIIKRKNVTYLSDYSLNEFENAIEIPMLSVLNFDIAHINNFQAKPQLKKFVMFNNPEFSNRKYDIMCRMGKPKPVRLLLSLLLLKHELDNVYTNVSYSREHSITNHDDGMLDLKHRGLYDIADKFNLNDSIDKLKIESYLGSMYNVDNTKFKNITHFGLDYTVDFNSCAEIYTESITNDLKTITEYPNLIAFTEKSFSCFFDFKIPLPVDSRVNIEYLENIGFKFPIKPCYIEPNDTLETMYNKLNEWIINLKKYNFKELWHKWVFLPPFESPLHHNHDLINEFMQKMNVETRDKASKPQYITTYKFIEKFFPKFLEDYKKWDYQTYLFLKDKKLI